MLAFHSEQKFRSILVNVKKFSELRESSLDVVQQSREALQNIVSKKLREFIIDIPEDLMSLSEDEIEEQWTGGGKSFPLKVRQLRIAFWEEYNRARHDGGKMSMRNIYGTICHPEYFYIQVCEDPRLLAYILVPTQTYAIETHALHDKSTKELQKILDIPLYSEKEHIAQDGRVVKTKVWNTSIAALKYRIWKDLDERCQGSVPKRHQVLVDDQRENKKEPIDVPNTVIKPEDVAKGLADVDRELDELEKDGAGVADEIKGQKETEIYEGQEGQAE